VSFALIERGRNFLCNYLRFSNLILLASSRDGTLKLWDCASQSCISNLVSFGSYSVNDCAVEENGEICDKNQKAQS
jgi:WD40 repeat protein